MADLTPYSPTDMSEWLPQRVCLINADTDGGSKAYDSAQANDSDVELYDADDLDICQHYGFFSIPPDDTEAVLLDTDAGPATVAERYPPPTTSAVSGLATGSVVTYGLDYQHWHYHPNGDIVGEPKAGQLIKLGSGAAKKLVLDGDVAVQNALMAAWMGQVEVFINGLVAGTVTPLSTTFASIATSTASATKVKGE